MNPRPWVLLFIGLVLWTSALVCIDWVLNYSLYRGMLEPLWLLEIPLTRIQISMDPWQAYYLAVLQLHAALILIAYSLAKLSTFSVKQKV